MEKLEEHGRVAAAFSPSAASTRCIRRTLIPISETLRNDSFLIDYWLIALGHDNIMIRIDFIL